MRTLLITVALLALLAGGCKKPSEVIVNPPTSTPPIKVTPISPDSSTIFGSDSTFTFHDDEEEYGGQLELVMIKIVGPNGHRDSLAYARAFFANKLLPDSVGGMVLGYFGLHLDTVSINGIPLNQRQHYIALNGLKVRYGSEYRVPMTTRYQPGTSYTWLIGDDTVGHISATIRSADDLKIFGPLSGSAVPRLQPLELRWIGSGDMTIVISAWDSVNQVAIPAATIEPDYNIGQAEIPLRVMAGLAIRFPRIHYYVITYILQNRKEDQTATQYHSGVLVHAALVYNTYVHLR